MLEMKNFNNFCLKVAAIAAVVLMSVAPVTVKAQTPDGTEENPFPIRTAAQLTSLAQRVNSGLDFYFNPADSLYKSTGTAANKIPYMGQGKFFKLVADITLNPGDVASSDGDATGLDPWIMLGTYAYPFDGVLDGDFHLISGVFVNSSSASSVGFCGATANHAIIRNLGVVNSYLGGTDNVGGLVGYMLSGTIEKCFFTGTVNSAGNYTGGLVGQIQAGTTISTSYSSATITSSGAQVGGIVGKIDLTDPVCVLSDLYSSSIVHGLYSYTGGIVGEDLFSPQSSYANAYYDAQLIDCPYTPYPQGIQSNTASMTTGSWMPSSGVFSAHGAGYYPYITGFDIDNDAVLFSIVPLSLPTGKTLSDLSDVSAIGLGGTSGGVAWTTAESVGLCAIDGGGGALEINGQCYVVLKATKGDNSRVYVLQCDKEPLLGTVTNPFPVDTLPDLTVIRNGVNGGARFTYKHFSIPAMAEGIHFVQTKDIDFSDVNSWAGIGNDAAKPFKGIYDGGNHAIIGWKYGTAASAFFWYTEGATIKNLTMRGVRSVNYAALVYCMMGGTVDNCHSVGSTSNMKGGLIYSTAVGDYTCIIKNCTNRNNIAWTAVGTYDRVGGILSEMGSANNTIENCHNYGNIASDRYPGGVVGGVTNGSSPSATITKCSNSGNVSSTVSDYANPSGIACMLTDAMTVSYCYNKGNITGRADRVAGIVATGGTISYCYNLGVISSPGYGRNTTLYGISYNKATYSFNAGKISNKATSDNNTSTCAYGISPDASVNVCFNAGDIYSSTGTAFSFISDATNKANHYTIGRVSGVGGATPGASYFDATRTPSYLTLSNGTSYTTTQLTGASASPFSSSANWVCEAGVYPRIKGLDTLTISKVLALPILFATGDNVDNVTQNFQVRSQWDIVWRVDNTSGATISAPSSNYQTVTVPSTKTNGNIILYAYKGDSCYYQITLKQGVTAPGELTVTSIGDLQALRTGVNSGAAFSYIGTAVPAGGKGATFKVTADIALGESQWTPIGTIESPFLGTFDGDGHTLSGLKHTDAIAEMGLFGYVKGKVKNVVMTDVNVTTTRNYGTVAAYLAGSEAEVSNCRVKGELTAAAPHYGTRTYRGGIVGVMSYGATISGCLNEVNITAQHYSYNGGIVARVFDVGSITNCANAGDLTGGYLTGGICAVGGDSIKYCVNYGNVTGRTYTTNIAGIVSSGGKVASCVNSGKISVPMVSVTTYIAGIAATSAPKYCYNVGEIEAKNAPYAGGISASYGAVRCYNAGKVTGDNAKPVCGGTPNHCYYDKQMSVAEQAGSDTMAKSTLQMVSDSLKGGSKLGTTNYFEFSDNMYPRIKGMENTSASYATAAPVFLQNNETVLLVNTDFTMGGCDNDVVWGKGTNTALSLTGCNATINLPGLPTLEAKKNDTVYKKVSLSIRMDAFFIKDVTEMGHFRDGINSGAEFYYSPSTYKYYTTLVTDSTTWITVPALGVGATFRLINDLDFEGADWTPVGTSDKQFKGTFDGDNHTISNYALSGSSQYRGLFGRINSGSVKNLTITGVTGNVGGSNAGFLVGYVETAEILDVTIENSRLTSSTERVGALAGFLISSTCKRITVSNVYLKGTNYVGGFVGRSDNGFKLYNSTVSYSHIEGSADYVGGVTGYTQHEPAPYYTEIRVIADTIKGRDYVGGWAGYTCWNTQSATKTVDVIGGTVSGRNYVGGIIGYYTGCGFYNFTNSASVSGNSHVGGIAGRPVSSYSSNTMTNCHNHGDVTGTGNYVGGIYGGDPWELGYLTINKCTNSGNVSGVNYVGGISGRATYNSTGYLIQNCVNTGDVTGTGNYVGGIVGESKGYTIGNTNAGRVTGVTYVGGIVGQQSNYPGYSRIAYNSLSVGQVFGDEFVGNVAGSAEDGTVSNCYYDNQISPDYKGLGNTGADAANIAVGNKTSDMLNTGIQSGLGTGYFTYEPNLYPRTTAVKDSVVAIVAATPVVLADTVTAYTIPGKRNYYITPSTLNSVSWTQEGDRFTPVVSPVVGFEVAASGKGVLTATLNGVSKSLYMMVGVSRELPCYIKNATQLTNFTNCINSGNVFWYNTETFEFLSSEPADLLSGITIQPGGSESFFKLDFDMSYEGGALWAGRIGTTAHPFLGDFNGGGHTITAMPKANTDTCGFFGVNSGSVYDLTMVNTNMDVDDATQKVVGALCGLNSGSITNCHVKNGTVAGTQYVGGVVGVNAGYVENTHNSAVVSGQQYVGGIAGSNTNTLRYSFNLANLTASGTSTYLGGVAGNNTNTLAYCYNAGNVTATGGSTDYVGGVVGRNTGSNFASCYNVGNVTAVNAATAGGVAGASDNTLISSLAYDRQMCVPVTVFGGTNGLATVAATQEMTGTGLQTILGTDNWTYTDGLYPRLTVMADSVASIVSVTPVFLDPAEKVTGVAHNFSVGTGNGVSWTTTSTTVLDMSNPASIAFIRCGKPTITASKTGGVETKDVILTINYTASETTVDTICGGSSFTWTVNGQTYYASNEVIVSTVDDGCPVTHRLILTVPGKLNIAIDPIAERCWQANNGRADITVTGGFNQYEYDWKLAGTTVSTEANPGATLAPGDYTLRVTDRLPSDENCYVDTSFTIDAAEEIVASIDTFSAGCYGVKDGMFQISVEGGTPGYLVSWDDPNNNRFLLTPQNNYSVTDLPDTNVNYTVKVTDEHNCEKTLPSFTLAENTTQYKIKAYSESKMYDGVDVHAGRFYLIKGTDTSFFTSGHKMVLNAANHDTLQVWVSQGDVVKAGEYQNVVTYEVLRDGTTDVNCQYNIVTEDGLVSISKRNVTLTSADTTAFATSTLPLPFGKHAVTQSGDKFTAADSAAITYTFTNDITALATTVNENKFKINWNGVDSLNYNVNIVYGTLTLVENGVITVRATGMRKTYDGVPVSLGQTAGTHYTIAAYNLYKVGGTTEDPIYDTIFYTSSSPNTITGASGQTYTVEVVMNDGRDTTLVDADTVPNVVTSFNVYEGTGSGRRDITSSFTHGQNKINDTIYINPIEIKLTSYGGEWEYDAQPHSRPGVSIEGSFHSGDISMSPYTDRAETNAGTYPNTITFETTSSFKAQNYKIDTVLGNLVITKRPLYLTGVTKLVDWNGSDQQDTVFTYGNLISGHIASGIHYLAHGIIVGDHVGVFSGDLTVTASGVDVTANYDTVQQPGYLGIQSATGALKIKSATASRIYNSLPLTAQTYEVRYKGVRVNPVDDDFHFKLSTGDTVVITPTNVGETGITDFGTARNDFSWTVRPISNYGQYNNENLELDTGILSIEKRPITLTSGSLTRSYNGDYIVYDTVLVGGALFVEGQGADYNFTNPHTWINVGKYTNAFTYSANGSTDFNNYAITKVEDTLRITKKEVVVKANNSSRRYGESNAFSYSMTGFVDPADVSGVSGLSTITYTCDADQFSNIGSYDISPVVTGLSADNYSFVSSIGVLTVTQRPITITANDVTVPYNGTWHTQVSDPATIADYGDLAVGDAATATMSFSRYAGGATDMTVANLHVTRESGSRDVTNNYLATASGQLIITKRALHLAVVDTAKTYDGTVLRPSRYVVVAPTSLAPGDVIPSESVVFHGEQTTVGYDSSYFQTGYFKIINPIADLYVHVNSYDITFDGAHVTVNPSPDLTITIPTTRTKTYDHTALSAASTVTAAHGGSPTLTYSTSTDNGATWSDFSATVPTITDVGSIKVTARATCDNYNTVDSIFTLTINPAELSITLNAEKIFDGEVFESKCENVTNGTTNGFTVSGLVEGDLLSCIVTSNSAAKGTYTYAAGTLTVSSNSSYSLSNYHITYDLTQTINIKAVSITVDNKSKVYGQDDPAFTGTVIGLEAGHENDLGTITYSRTNASVQNAGTYNGVIVPNYTENINYEVTVTPGNFVINRAGVTVKADAQTKAYGDVDPTLTATLTGLQYDENATLISYTLNRVGGENIGKYVITPAGLPTQGNYSVTYVQDTLTITPATATVTADAQTKVYGETDPTLTATVTGIRRPGDVIDYTLARESGDNVGTYTITPTGDATQGNYTVTFVPSDFTITKKALTITALDSVFAYDGSVKTQPHYTVSGLVGSDAISGIHTDGSIQYVNQSPVVNRMDTSAMTFNPGQRGNYDITLVNGTLRMDYTNRKDLTISSLGGTWTYDGQSHSKNGMSVSVDHGTAEESTTNTYTIPGSNDVITITLGTNVIDVTAGTPNAIASYTINNGSVDVRGNYNVLLNTANLVVTPQPATITANSHSWIYDGYAHSDDGYTVTGLISPDTLTATVEGSITTQGTVDNNVTAYSMTRGRATNYTFTLVRGTLEVTQRPVGQQIALTITANSASKMYDGSALTADGYDLLFNDEHYTVGSNGIFDFINGDRLTVDIQGSNTHVADGNANTVNSWKVMHDTVNVSSSYNVTPVNGTLTITPRHVILTSATDSKTYDGEALTNHHVTISGNGFISGEDTLSCNVVGTQTEVGSSRNRFNTTTPYTLTTATAATDYTIDTVSGTLTIAAPDEVVVTITGHTDSKVYNGTEQSITGYDWTSSNPLYNDTKFTFTGAVADSTAARTDVDTTYMGLTRAMFTNIDATNFPNVTFNVTDGYMAITPITNAIVVTAKDSTHVYDGQELRAQTVGYTDNSSTILVSGDNLVVTMEGAITHFGQTPSHVADVKVMRSGTDVTDNYTIGTPVDAVLSITKRNVTLTSGSAVEVYNGVPVVKRVVEITSGSFVGSEDTLSCSVTGSRTDVGESPNTFTYELNTATQAADYNITTVEGLLKVNPLENVTVTITEHSDVVTYDGAPHTVTGYDFAASTPLYRESDFTFTGSASVTGTNADTYPMTLTDAMFTNNNSNFSGVTFNIVDGSLVINPVTTAVTVTITGHHQSRIYDGNEYTVSGYDWESNNSLYNNSCFTTTNAASVSRTEVGTTTMGLEGTFSNTNSNFTNVTFDVEDGYLTITRNSTTLAVNCPASTSHVYDGDEFSGDAATATVTAGTTIQYSIDNGVNWTTTQPSLTNVDSKLVKVRAVNPNYDTATCSYTLEVTPAPVVVTAASQQFTYTGAAQSNNHYTVTGMTAADEALFVATVTGSITYPSEGTVANRVTGHTFNTGFSSESNYTITDVNGALTMIYGDQIPLAITTGSEHKVYDGITLTNSIYTVSENGAAADSCDANRQVKLSNGDTITVNFNGAGVTNVAQGNVSNTISNYTITHNGTDVSGKYIVSTTLGTLYIDKKDITVTGDDHEFTYNGHEQTWPYYTVTGLVGTDTLTVTMTGAMTYPGASVPNVPSAPYNFFRGSSDNYNVAFANGALTMVWPDATAVTVKAVTDTMIYSGSALSNGAYTVTVGGETYDIAAGGSYTFANGDVLTATITGSVTTVAQSASDANHVGEVTIMNGTTDVSGAYTVTKRDSALVIKKRPVTLTSATDSKTYDTHPLTNRTVTVGGMGFVAGQDTASCNVTGTQTDIGTSTNTFTYTLATGTDADNYDITKVEGTLTVNATGTVTVEITENSDSFEYDGTEKSVTGYTVTHISDPNYTTSMINYVGTDANKTVVGTKAGTYNMGLLPTHFLNTNDNYTVNFVIVDGTLTITPKATPIVITAGSDHKVYDGTALTSNASRVTSGTLAHGDTINTTSTGTITHVGIVTNSIATYRILNASDEDVTSCYTFGTHVNGQLEINARPVTLTSATDTWAYNGQAHTNTTVTPSTGTNEGFVSGEGATYNVTGTITDAGSVNNMFTYTLTTETRATDYNIAVAYGTLTVTPVAIAVTITGNHDSQVYDGTDHTVTGYTVDAGTTWNSYYSAADVTCDTVATATQKLAGTKNMGLADRHFHNTNSNFSTVTFTVTDGYMTITKVTEPIVITANSAHKMYDGTALEDHGFTYTGTLVPGDALEVEISGEVTHVSEGDVTNAVTSYKVMRGTTEVTASYNDITTANGTLYITKRDVVLTSGTASRNFNGQPLTAQTVEVTGSGFVAADAPTSYSNFNSRTNVGVSDNTFEYSLQAGAQATDYDIDTVKGTLTVNKAELTITSASHNFLYDGEYHRDTTYSVVLNGVVVPGIDVADGDYQMSTEDDLHVEFPASSKILRPSESPVTNAFNYSFVTPADANNYQVTVVNGELNMSIDPVRMPLAITTEDRTWTYDGESHTYKVYTVTENWLTTPHTFTVDSTEHGVCTLSTGDRLYVNIGGFIESQGSRENFINDITITRNGEDVSGAYEVTRNLGELKIERRPLLITGDTAHFVYNGAVRQSTVCHVYGLVTGESVIVQATGSIQFPSQSPVTNPVGTITFATGDANNYALTVLPGKLTMSYDPTALTLVANSQEWNYDGNAHSDARYTLTIGTDAPITNVEAGEYPLLYGDVMTVTVTGSVTNYADNAAENNVIAITSIKHGSEDVSGNYTPQTLTNGTLTINRISATVTVTGNSSTVVYNGAEQRVDGYTVAINEPLYTTADFTFAGGTDTARRTDIGTTSMTMVETNFTNNNTNFDPVTFNITNGSITITPITTPIVITAASDSKVYDATALTNAGYTFTDGVLAGTDVLTAVVEGTQTTVGSSDNTVTSYEVKRGAVDVTSNYTFGTSVDGTLEVTARPITITANDYSVMYDGVAHNYAQNTSDIVTVEAAGTDRGLLAVHHLADTTMTGSGTTAGTYPIVISAAVIENDSDEDVTANYDITFEEGSLTITPRTGVEVTIQEHGLEVEYDANSHTVTGYSVSINDPLYHESDITFTGAATVTGTGTETGLNVYPMLLTVANFANNNPNFTDVTFNILDSALYIYPKLKVEVTATTDIYCHGGNNGTATVTVTGGKPNNGKYSFVIDGGASAEFTSPHTFEGLTEGNHTVVVTDSLNYSVEVTFRVDELPELTATIVTPTELCPNQGSYPVSVTVAGGTTDYSYEWSGDATDANAASTTVNQIGANDGEQEYTVTVEVTDAHTCTATASATFTVKPSVTKPGSITYTCARDTSIVLNYGAVDTMIILNQPTYTSHFTQEMMLNLEGRGLHATNRYAVPEGREDTTYIVKWHLTDTCGGDSLICTQRITVSYPACGSVVIGGVSQPAVRLGGNCWTRANLSVVPQPLSRAASPNGTYKYNNDDALAAEYGYLYTWYAACHVTENDNSAVPVVSNGHVQGICPDGWALPTAEDFIYMVEAIGGVPHMKIADDSYWISGLEGTTPSSGFDALGAGYYKSSTDSFEGLMSVARFWTATPSGSSVSGTAVQCAVCEGEDIVVAPKADGYSLRCVRVQ